MIKAGDIHQLIASKENCLYLGDSGSPITGLSDWASFNGNSLVFYKHRSLDPLLKWQGTPGGLIITLLDFKDKLKPGPFLLVSQPQRAFIYAAELLKTPSEPLIHPTALIEPEAKIGKNVSIGAYSVIGKAEIGEGSIIGSHVSVKDKVKIGASAKIMNGAILGEPGLGSVMDYDGNQVLFPHTGGLVIGDHFVLGSGSIVNCGALTDTVIGNHVHVSSNCLVAHNCRLADNVYVAASAQIAGSVVINERCYIGFGAVLTHGIELASGITVGIGCTIMKSYTERDATLMNQPQIRSLGKLFSNKRS